MVSPASSVTRTETRDAAEQDKAERGSASSSSSRKVGRARPAAVKAKGGIEDVLPDTKDLKAKDTHVMKKKRWWLKEPRAPYASFDDAPLIPLVQANWFSRITFLCTSLSLGPQRSLQTAR